MHTRSAAPCPLIVKALTIIQCGLPLIGHSMRVCAVKFVVLVIRGVPYLSSLAACFRPL